jgi:hypothetical protein
MGKVVDDGFKGIGVKIEVPTQQSANQCRSVFHVDQSVDDGGVKRDCHGLILHGSFLSVGVEKYRLG